MAGKKKVFSFSGGIFLLPRSYNSGGKEGKILSKQKERGVVIRDPNPPEVLRQALLRLTLAHLRRRSREEKA